jgi:phosphopantetheine adenylyltransferase
MTNERIIIVLGTVISFNPMGIGGCSISSDVSAIHDLVTVLCQASPSSRLAYHVSNKMEIIRQ